ncbi:hypothetical protein DL768_000621 [Monosporascus sp. mg162]|nr:hypothetical protein DL768_000621 [Monosporascus sp. mg162]
MEVIGLVGVIVQAIGAVSKAVGYLKDVRDAPGERAKITQEAGSLVMLLSELKCRIEAANSKPTDPWFATVRSLCTVTGPLAQLKEAMEELTRKLRQPTTGAQKLGRSLLWTVEKGVLKDILVQIERLKSTIGIALQMDNVAVSQAIDAKLALVSDDVVERERRKVVDWISSLNFSAKQDDSLGRREQGTGDWILSCEEFKRWLSGSGGTLWCRGIPGAGKTVLTSVVVDHLAGLKASGQDMGLAYVYCSYKERRDHTATNLIANILRQLIQDDTAIPGDVMSLYSHHERKGTHPNLFEWSKLLRSEVRRFSNVFIAVDALDERREGDEATSDDLLAELKALQPHVHLFITSRPSSAIEHELEDAIRLEIHARDSDVRTYLEQKVAKTPRLKRHTERDPTLRNEITNIIIEKSRGMFLLAHLQMDLIVRKDNIKAIRKELSTLPRSLNSMYEETMKRIRNQEDGAERALQILAWLTYALRPMSLTAMQHALAVDEGDDEFDEAAMPDEETLASVCAGLVSVEQGSQTIQLVHYSAQEYLRQLPMSPFLEAPAVIAATCLRYLSFGAFGGGPCPSDRRMEDRMRDYPFLEYAARHWGDHARDCQHVREAGVNKLALAFLSQDAKVTCSVQAMHLPAYRRPGYSQHFPRNVTSLHLSAYFGLAEIACEILRSEKIADSIDAQDSNGRTPLSLVAEKGYTEAAAPLLDNGANVGTKDNRGWTALHWACKGGHELMARCLLLRQGVGGVGAKDKQGATALYWAAEKGHEATVRLLLENGAEVNLREGRGTTPLQGASAGGHEGVARLLLDKGADIDAQDEYFGRTALHRAAGGGHVQVLKLLLERGADVDAVNNWNRTALHRAAGAGREAVVGLLLEQGADTTLKDTVQGATALHAAADGGHTAVVSLLIGKGADVKARNDEKWATPLHWAARRGHEGTVRRLMEHGAEIAARDKSGMTALHEAAANGRDGVIQFLLDQIDIGAEDDQGATPLHWAAAGGHEVATALLLSKGANAQAVDKEGRTALHYAAEAKNTSGTNALHRAAKEGDLATMQMLLTEGVDVNSRDSTGATALHWAAAWGHEPAVRLLLENGVEVTAVDRYGWSALHRAANDRHGGSSRHEAATWLLLERVDAMAAEAAAAAEVKPAEGKAGSDDVGHPAVQATPPKILAPLPNAATAGHTKVARLLLDNGADVGATDGMGKTALDEAATSGHNAMVFLLLQYGMVSVKTEM